MTFNYISSAANNSEILTDGWNNFNRYVGKMVDFYGAVNGVNRSHILIYGVVVVRCDVPQNSNQNISATIFYTHMP